MILHVLSNDGPGGTQSVTIGHAAVLAGAGQAQQVLFLSGPTGSRAVLDVLGTLGAQVLHLPLDGRRWRFAVRFARLCRRGQVDAVFAHGLGFHLVLTFAAWAAGVRRVVVLAGNPIASDRSSRRRVRRRSRLADPLVERIVACSQHVADDVIAVTGLRPGRVVVVPNPLDVRVIAARAAAAREARRPGGPSIVCTVARLDPIKDHPTVLRAVARLRQSGRDVVLRLAGSGPTQDDLAALAARLGIAGVVEFLGDRTDIPELLGASDVFALGMTREEGYGVAVAEAMAAGTPVVCTDEGPAREVLQDGRGGRLVPPGDDAAMAEAIAALLDDPADARGLATDALDICQRRHDLTLLEGQVRELAGIS